MKSLSVLVASTMALFYFVSLPPVAATSEQPNHREAIDEQQILQRAGKLIGLTPTQGSGLSRFFVYSTASPSRPYESRQATPINTGSGAIGYKRSSSALDALTGVTLGKRSVPNYEYINMEPILGRQYSMHIPMSRMYDIRWAPVDSYDVPSGVEAN